MNVSLQETLIYYDAPQLFVAVDKVGTRFLCVLVEQSETNDRCLCVPISPRRLAEFNLGNIDLRSIYEHPEVGTCWIGSISESYDTISLEPVQPDEIREEWLPEPGFLFRKDPENAAVVQKIASEENRAIVDLAVNPPEARGTGKISPSHLVDILESFQLAVKYAFQQAKRMLGADADDELQSPLAHAMNVAAFAPGSFKIRFESEQSADMLGHVHLSMALRKLDELTQHVDDPQASLEVMKQNKGHLASAFLRLLESIIENDAPFTYSWSTPDTEQPVTRQITKQQAIPLYELFNSQNELTRVEVEFVGIIIKVDTTRKTWTIKQSKDNKEVSGRVHEESNRDLSGIVVEEVEYRFKCLETIEETIGTGRKKTNLYMLDYDTIQRPTA